MLNPANVQEFLPGGICFYSVDEKQKKSILSLSNQALDKITIRAY